MLFEGVDDEQGIVIREDALVNRKEEVAGTKALGPASPSVKDKDQDDEISVAPKQVFMITREMKRIMIEELGYRRSEVDSIRLDLVADIISNRARCPAEGMPTEWIDQEREAMNNFITENPNGMMKLLESESKYPLKFPLLAVSFILFGKGLSDALITLIKVNIDFPGASLTQQFQGIPILAIDFVCIVAGVVVALWTLKTMK